MTARPDSPTLSEASKGSGSVPPETDGLSGLIAAIAIAGIGALLAGLAPVVGVVDGAAPAFTSWPWLLVLAALPAVLALLFLRAGRRGLAAAVLITPAVLAPGRLVLDAQLVLGAGDVAQPELLLPDSLEQFPPAAGTWMLLAAHAVACIAGVVAAVTSGDRGSAVPAFGSAETGSQTAQGPGARRQALLALVLCAAFAAGVGALMTQLASDNPYLVPHAAVDSPVVVLVGSVLFAVGIPAAGGLAVSSAEPEFARGGLLGLAAAIAAYAVPSLVAATFVPGLHYGSGAVTGLVAALALAALAIPAGRVAHDEHEGEQDLSLPAGTRLNATSGGLAVLAGVLGLVATVTPVLRVPEFLLSNPATYPVRMLWPAGAVLLVLGAAVLWRPIAAWARPALAVAWAVLPLVVAAVLDSVFASFQVPETAAEPGTWIASAAAVLAAAAAVVAAVTGAVERDDVDLTEVSRRPAAIVPAVLVLSLTVGAFSFPTVTGPEYTPPGIFVGFTTASWGQVIALAAIVVATVLVPSSRPSRAAGLLGGSALVLLVRVLEFPLTQDRVPGSGPGPGLWIGIAGIVVSVAAAVLVALWGRTSAPSGDSSGPALSE